MSTDPMYCGYREHEQTHYAAAEIERRAREGRAGVHVFCADCGGDLTDWSDAVRELHRAWHDDDRDTDAALARRAALREDEDREEAHC